MNEELKAAIERTARKYSGLLDRQDAFFAGAISWAEKYGEWCRADERAKARRGARVASYSFTNESAKRKKEADRLYAELVKP